MTAPHPDLGPELRALAQLILDRLDPTLRAAAAFAADGEAGKCEQVWCPVCALAALVSGQQHPLLTVVAEHSVALLAVIRAMVDDNTPNGDGPRGPAPEPPPGNGDQAPPPPRSEPATGRYQSIPVTVEE